MMITNKCREHLRACEEMDQQCRLIAPGRPAIIIGLVKSSPNPTINGGMEGGCDPHLSSRDSS